MSPHPAWLRMRPKTDANLTQLKELVRQQFLWEISRQIGASEQFDYATLNDIEENYRSSSNSLEQLLEFPDYQQANNSNVVPSFSVYVISNNPIFPPEWRRNAYKTFLPNDLPKQLVTWQNYIVGIKQGKFQAYLFDLYLYWYTERFYNYWYSLRGRAKASLKIDKAWNKRSRIVPIRNQILNFPEPYLHPAPIWVSFEWLDAEQHSDTGDIYKLVCQQIEEYKKLNRNWNSKVPKNEGISLMKKWEIADFIKLGMDNSLIDNFFIWVEGCTQQRMGLFLGVEYY